MTDRCDGIAVDEFGNVYLSGVTRGNLGVPNAGGDDDAFIAKYNAVGERDWTRQIHLEQSDGLGSPSLSLDGLGNAYISGRWSGIERWDINNGFLAKFWTDLPDIAANFNSDLVVDDGDLAAWQQHFGSTANVTHAMGDADGDGMVTGSDFLRWQREYGSLVVAADAVVPEPATIALAVIAVLGGCGYGFQRRLG